MKTENSLAVIAMCVLVWGVFVLHALGQIAEYLRVLSGR